MDRLYLHLVWATWKRLPLVTPERERVLAEAMTATARALGAEILQMGGMPDHIHVLVRFPSTVTVAELVKRLKGSSSHRITRENGSAGFFRWQKGYGAYSVSRWDVGRVRRYIRHQREHHERGDLRGHLERMGAE